MQFFFSIPPWWPLLGDFRREETKHEKYYKISKYLLLVVWVATFRPKSEICRCSIIQNVLCISSPSVPDTVPILRHTQDYFNFCTGIWTFLFLKYGTFSSWIHEWSWEWIGDIERFIDALGYGDMSSRHSLIDRTERLKWQTACGHLRSIPDGSRKFR